MNRTFIKIKKIGNKLSPIEISKNESNRVVNLLVCINHYVLIEKLNVFLGRHDYRYNWRLCLSSYTSQYILIEHKQQCDRKK